MKKILLVLAMLLMLSTACLGLAGCDYTTGEIGKIDYDPESKTIYWEKVEGADNYTVFENGKRLLNTNDTKFPVSALKEDISYITVAPTKYLKDTGLSEEYLFITKGYEGIVYTILEDQSGYHATFVGEVPKGTMIYVQSVYYGLPVKNVYIKASNQTDNYQIFVPDCIEIYSILKPNGNIINGNIKLPLKLKNLECSSRCSKFEISKYNEHFVVQDGVLYDKTMETLVNYPTNMEEKKFIVPESVKTILDIQNEYLTEIKLPQKLKIIETLPPNLIELSIPASVEEICVGNLFNGRKIIFENGFNIILKSITFWPQKECDVFIPNSLSILEEGAILGGDNYTVTIHCAAKQKPTGWADNWQYGCEVIWGENW